MVFPEKTFQLSNLENETFVFCGPYGGQIFDMVTETSNNDIMYAGIVKHGERDKIYKTTDGGNNWFFLSSIIPSYSENKISMFSMDIHPFNSSLIYIGSSQDIYKSEDNGVSWDNKKIKMGVNSICYGIEVNKINPNIIYGYGCSSDNLCFFKSVDVGENWEDVIIKSPSNSSEQFIYNKNYWAIDQNDYQTIYIATTYYDNLKYYTFLFRSTNGGSTWKNLDINSYITTGNYIQSIDVDSNGHVIMCLEGSGIYKSTDLGETWIKLTSSPDNLYSIKVLKDNPDIIVGGSTDTINISFDGGIVWNNLSNELNGGIIETILLNSTQNIIIGNKVGIFVSSDSGKTWNKKVYGLNPEKNIIALDISKQNPYTIFAILNDGLYKSNNAGKSWKIVMPSFHLTSLLICDDSSTVAYVTECDPNSNICYIYKTTNGGSTWHQVSSIISSHCTIITMDDYVCISYFNQSAGIYRFAKSIDGGLNWTESNIVPYSLYNASLIVNPMDSNELYVSGYSNYNSGSIHKSTDGGAFWSNVYNSNVGVEINSICFDYNNNIYFGASNGIFKSTDSGNTWNKIYNNYCKVIYVDNNGNIYGGGQNSVFVLPYSSTTWKIYSEGLPSNIKRNCLAVDDTNNQIYVGTVGWGIFSVCPDISTKFNEDNKKETFSYELFKNYPNPFNQQTAIIYQLSVFRKVKIEIYNTLGQVITTIVDENKQPGKYKVIWNGKDMHGRDVPSGIYFYSLKAGEFTDVKKMILMR